MKLEFYLKFPSIARRGLVLVGFLALALPSAAQTAHDPGVQTDRPPPPAQVCGHDRHPGDPIPIDGLTADQLTLFCAGADEFAKFDKVKDDGLGPTMNFTSCGGCHLYPQSGGSSPLTNPQYRFSKEYPPGTNVTPSFITEHGPVREARFKHNNDGTDDGGVHDLFTITGLPDAAGCNLKQPDFAGELAKNNVIFRIPTPTFGAGLIEQIEDSTIIASHEAKRGQKYGGSNGYTLSLGHLNFVRVGHTTGKDKVDRNGNDGTIARFGWKAQNKSLLVFAAEAYNVEMGVSNELFQTEREEKASCQFHAVPNDVTHPEKLTAANPADRLDALSDIEKFAAFMRFLAPPQPSIDKPGGKTSIDRGRERFEYIGCAHCHTPALKTSHFSEVTALRDKTAWLYSDLALHDLGPGLADGVSQGQAGKQEFRSAPLWGLGQRTFFLHDGRTDDLVAAIKAHASKGSEASPVVTRYKRLSEEDQQHLLNFLRSL